MAVELDESFLSDGVLVRHRTSGYVGRIDGVTALQSCFTQSGMPMPLKVGKETFQYRVIVSGEKMRRIAPLRDLEVLDATTAVEVTCVNCRAAFSGTTTVNDKPGGLCACGGWICSECLHCQPSRQLNAEGSAENCPNQRKRLLKRTTTPKPRKSAKSKFLPDQSLT
jgi:hypothetical protein